MAGLPRRFAQRQSLRHDRSGAPSTLLNGEEQFRVYESRVKLKRRNRARKSSSTHEGNSAPDSSSEVTKDSGYNSMSNSESDSDSDTDTKPMNVKRMIQEFKEEGVTLSNPCNETKAMIEAELERWEDIVYARLVEGYMKESVLYNIRNIPQVLTPTFRLDDSEKEKSGLFVRDTEVFAHKRLRLFPPLIKGRPLIVIMKLNLKRVKRSSRKRKR
ncbi:hypothetical protein BJ875DRAFT_508698 [Amylocarpus encephaloides]|uniref:Uncharacterized protein n=1 Tax=Amylocarpus encephaloides TaxID=45428 RepID=A0A9P7Y6C6_9HELO|nr:hypothetical protein BJ875DRAFT_508698 [Amylocarpus encephaloides]